MPEVVNKQANRTRENNWLRDNLPQLLKHHPQHNLHARVMTFGYNADVWMTKSVADLDVPVNNLILYLNVERAKVRQSEAQDSPKAYLVRLPTVHSSSLATVWVES